MTKKPPVTKSCSAGPGRQKMPTEILFSINSLPKDRDLLKLLQRKINLALGEAAIDLNQEILENLRVAKRIRNELCGFDIQEDEEPLFDASTYDQPPRGREKTIKLEETKDSAKVSSIATFSSIIMNIVKLQEVIH